MNKLTALIKSYERNIKECQLKLKKDPYDGDIISKHEVWLQVYKDLKEIKNEYDR